MAGLRRTLGGWLRRSAARASGAVQAGAGARGDAVLLQEPPAAADSGRRGGQPGPGPKRRYLADAQAGIARVRAAGHARPMVLATWPLDRQNPFQALLTSRVEEQGIVHVGMDRLADLDDPLALPALAGLREGTGATVVLHLHWLARVLRDVASEAEGRERVDRFLAAIDAFRSRGGRLVWTVHNILPHDSRSPALDLDLRRAVVERADVVHVLSAGTVEAAAPWYELPPGKVLHLPHPSYRGAYPQVGTDAEARVSYGFDPDDLVFGVVGHLRPYKGLDGLLDAFTAVAARGGAAGALATPHAAARASSPGANQTPRHRLLIAGKPAADPGIQALLDRARSHPDVVVDARPIPPEELARPIQASDVIVLPYRSSLNSGALLLALTFGRPVIAATSPHVSETVGSDAAITFEPDDRGALESALRAADRLRTPAARAAALATASRFDPDELSRRFAAALRDRLGRD